MIFGRLGIGISLNTYHYFNVCFLKLSKIYMGKFLFDISGFMAKFLFDIGGFLIT